MIKRILIIIAVVIAICSLVGCQTVQGIGKDITAIGEAGERAIERQ
jgi:predicted small secreted protein